MAASVGEGSGGTTNWGLSFSYDVYGNRTGQTVTAGSAPAFSASFGSNNRMVGYSYDNNGNQLTTPDGATLEYDADNRLTKWTKQGQTDQYQYHPSGWRLSKGSEKYLYGPGGQLLESYRGWNDITDYVYFGGRLLYTLSAGQAVTRIYSDRLGSTRATETIQQYGGGWTTRNYYPFGEEITSTSNDQYKFASTYRDSATGLDYAVNRYYASGTGRFLTVDPAKRSAKPRRPGTWNRYAYVGNDPINHRDPLGLDDYTEDPEDCEFYGDCGDDGPNGTGFSAGICISSFNGQVVPCNVGPGGLCPPGTITNNGPGGYNCMTLDGSIINVPAGGSITPGPPGSGQSQQPWWQQLYGKVRGWVIRLLPPPSPSPPPPLLRPVPSETTTESHLLATLPTPWQRLTAIAEQGDRNFRAEDLGLSGPLRVVGAEESTWEMQAASR